MSSQNSISPVPVGNRQTPTVSGQTGQDIVFRVVRTSEQKEKEWQTRKILRAYMSMIS